MKLLFVPVCLGLILTACATSHSTPRPDPGAMDNISPIPVKPVSCKIPIVIELDASTKDSFKMPVDIYVCTKQQDVYWYAKGAKDFKITYRPDSTVSHKVAKLNKSKADCEPDIAGVNTVVGYLCVLKKSDHIDGGDLKYDFRVTAQNDQPISVDPRLIIQP